MTHLEGVGGLRGQEGELGGNLGWAGRAAEQTTDLTQAQTHPVHGGYLGQDSNITAAAHLTPPPHRWLLL
jgi:hypothetical protein